MNERTSIGFFFKDIMQVERTELYSLFLLAGTLNGNILSFTYECPDPLITLALHSLAIRKQNYGNT